jgi:hypothetical protein
LAATCHTHSRRSDLQLGACAVIGRAALVVGEITRDAGFDKVTDAAG